MAWRWRKTIRIAPGIKLNLLKSGVSTTLGARGASVNLGGKRGPRATVGLPGTGLSHTSRLAPPTPAARNSPANGDDVDARRRCPHCAELIRREAVVCRWCGRDVEPLPPAPELEFAPPAERIVLGQPPRSGARTLVLAAGAVIGLFITVAISNGLSPPAAPAPAAAIEDPRAFRTVTGRFAADPLVACGLALVQLDARKVAGAHRAKADRPWIVQSRVVDDHEQARCVVRHPSRGEGYVIATRLCDQPTRACTRPELLSLRGAVLYRRAGFVE